VDEVSELDFLSALGQEFCWALSPPVPNDLIVPHDGTRFGYVHSRPNPHALASLTDAGLEELRAVCAGYFECPTVSAAQVRLAISRTLARWPSDA
jgi:hypothetical protein